MSKINHNIDQDIIMQGIQHAVRDEIEQQIYNTLNESIQPRIKEIAKQAVETIVKNGTVFLERQYDMRGDKINIQVNFIEPKDIYK